MFGDIYISGGGLFVNSTKCGSDEGSIFLVTLEVTCENTVGWVMDTPIM